MIICCRIWCQPEKAMNVDCNQYLKAVHGAVDWEYHDGDAGTRNHPDHHFLWNLSEIYY